MNLRQQLIANGNIKPDISVMGKTARIKAAKFAAAAHRRELNKLLPAAGKPEKIKNPAKKAK